MARRRHTEEQIIAILKQGETGVGTLDLCRQNGISSGTYYNWKAKYGGMVVSDMRRLKVLEEENRKLKQALAEEMLHHRAAKELLSKNW